MKKYGVAKHLASILLLAYGLPTVTGPGYHYGSGCHHEAAHAYSDHDSRLEASGGGTAASHDPDCPICAYFKQQQTEHVHFLPVARMWWRWDRKALLHEVFPREAMRSHLTRGPPAS